MTLMNRGIRRGKNEVKSEIEKIVTYSSIEKKEHKFNKNLQKEENEKVCPNETLTSLIILV